MKFFLSLGGSIGFLAAFFSALHGGSGVGYALRAGAIGCLAGALLLRGFHYVVILCIKSLVQEQAYAEAGAGPSKPPSNGAN